MKTILKKLKKGFTIVELVIVIAVIAILAAVLIPTLANLVDSANESNDMVLVSNLNKIVAAYDTVGEIETVNDALDGALENGYSVSNLTPTSEGNVIVYDDESNRFALLTADALTTTTPDDDDIIYKDTSTTKTDWTDYTTWVFVDASATTNGYVTITTSGESYTITGTNSYILTGTDWNGRSVIANYGVVLYDNTNSVTLNSVTIKESTQTGVKADTNSSAKTAISKKTIDNTSSAISIVVNVKANNLTCSLSDCTVDNYSEISVATAVKNCNFNEHGSALGYDWTQIGDGKFTNHNSDLNPDFIYIPTGKTIDEVYVDNTSNVPSSTLTYQNAYEVSIEITVDSETGASTITLKVTSSKDATPTEISGSIESGAVTLQLGTEKYPYLVEDDLQKTIETYATDEGKTYYFMLTEDVVATATNRGRNYTTIKSNIIVNGNSKTISADAEKETPTCVYLTSNGTYQFTLYNANILGYIEQTKAVLDLKGFDVTIEDCTIKETGTSCTDSCAITITGAKDINITNCTFTNSRLEIKWGNSDTENVAELSCTIESTSFSYYISNYDSSSDTAMGLINFGNSTDYSGQYSVSVKIFDVTVEGRMQNVFVDDNTVSTGSKATKLSYEVDTLNVTVSSYNGSDSTAFDVTLKSILGISDSDGVSVTETNCTYQVDGKKYSSYKDYTISE